MRTLLIDNYDSFTYNLFQVLAEVNGEEPLVVTNNALDWPALSRLSFENVVISPGPGRPKNHRDFGVCAEVLRKVNRPTLGVCLGHQGLGEVYGARVIQAPEVMHGRHSSICHDGSDLFEGIPPGFSAVRYHSLIVSEGLPDCLERIAWTTDGCVMGLRHRARKLWGLQFHPESIGTEFGARLIRNFRKITERESSTRRVGSVEHPSFRIVNGRARKPKTGRRPCVRFRKLDFLPDGHAVFSNLFGGSTRSFWLDSSRVEEGLSRFSFMGDDSGDQGMSVEYRAHTNTLVVTEAGGERRYLDRDVFDFLRDELDARRVACPDLPVPFAGGFVGYFGYELKKVCGAEEAHTSRLPDAAFILAGRFLAFDHQDACVYLVTMGAEDDEACANRWFDWVTAELRSFPQKAPTSAVPDPTAKTRFKLNRSRKEYLADIKHCLDEIHRGESYEICLTNEVSTAVDVDPLALYQVMRRINPAPYACYLKIGEYSVLSSSPERFLKIDRDGCVESKPIKGTSRRGQDAQEDEDLRLALGMSTKDRAENLMIVDLLRNDLGRVCEVGSVDVPKMMDVETYQTVHQLVSTVVGQLKHDVHPVDCIKAAFPGGSMTGAPKLRTMEILDQLERRPRGPYSGALGYLGFDGAVDLSIVIRTAVLHGDLITMGCGGAIVSLSDPESEYQEMLLKVEALIRAIIVTVYGRFQEGLFEIEGSDPVGSDRHTERLEVIVNELEGFREELDSIDEELVGLVARRLDICRGVAQFKRANDVPMMQPNRVEVVKSKCARIGESQNLSPEFVRGLYDMIISEACRIEDEIVDATTGDA